MYSLSLFHTHTHCFSLYFIVPPLFRFFCTLSPSIFFFHFHLCSSLTFPSPFPFHLCSSLNFEISFYLPFIIHSLTLVPASKREHEHHTVHTPPPPLPTRSLNQVMDCVVFVFSFASWN
jgi:hypothetical protein